MFNRLREIIANSLLSIIDANLEDLPENADRFLKLAKIKYGAGDLDGAIEAATTVIANQPNNVDAYYWRCRSEYDNGQTVQALHDALRVAKLRPNHRPSLYLLGNIYLRLDNYSEARLAYTRAIDLDGTNAESWVGRGFANYSMNSNAAALDDLEMAESMGYDYTDLTPYICELKRQLENDA